MSTVPIPVLAVAKPVGESSSRIDNNRDGWRARGEAPMPRRHQGRRAN